MKTISYTGILIVWLMAGLLSSHHSHMALPKDIALAGAWSYTNSNGTTTTIFSDKYFATAVYDKDGKTFAGTMGGSWKMEGNKLMQLYEFNTLHTDLVGTSVTTELAATGNTITNQNTKETWSRLDDGTPGKLAGAWLITGRYNNGELRTMTPGARRTMKILSGTRFQWIAYNVDTKEFFGTGGGTYTTVDGKYTENIDFFSRDGARVGASLVFDYAIEDGKWRHKGFSSKGDPLDEVWTKREVIGI